MPLREISEVRGSMVLSIEGEPALEVLSTVAHALVDQPLVFVALADRARRKTACARRSCCAPCKASIRRDTA